MTEHFASYSEVIQRSYAEMMVKNPLNVLHVEYDDVGWLKANAEY